MKSLDNDGADATMMSAMTETITARDKKMSTFAEAETRLAETLEGYESRPQQQTLARAVEDAIADRHHLLAEAGTGTGKSLGYLIPSVLSGKRVIVSTATKALQDQIANKDIPFLQDNLIDFTGTILKGRSNYICLNRVVSSDLDPSVIKRITDEIEGHPYVEGERDEFTGEQKHFPFLDWRDWNKVSSDSEECGDCQPDECFASRARHRAAAAQVVVVNHALYMTELMINDKTQGNVSFLGDHDVVVFDEAHEIEEYAAGILGDKIRERGVENLMGEVSNFFRQYDPQNSRQANSLVSEATAAARALWATLEEGRIKFPELEARADEFVGFTNALHDLAGFIAAYWPRKVGPFASTEKKRGAKVRRDVEKMYENMLKIVTDDFTATVRWVEKETSKVKKVQTLSLNHGPVDVSPHLRRMLFATSKTAILTSATLMAGGTMEYIAGRLGVDEYDSLDVGTPFDYKSQSRLYVPSDLPNPAKERDQWSMLSINRMRELVNASEGRALLLFTSISEMRSAYSAISANVDYPCKMQGDGEDNQDLAEWFKENTDSILFATRSFMTGVDFQGDTLSLVVINKLPFPVPTEALTEARTEAIEARGGNAFAEYTIPVMTLILKQAFGRLIRHRNDRGVVAILDPRLTSKGYGKGIIRSLPDAPLITTLDEVKEMYS